MRNVRIVRHEAIRVLNPDGDDFTTNASEWDYEGDKLVGIRSYFPDGSTHFDVQFSYDDKGKVSGWAGATFNAEGEPHFVDVLVPR